MAAPTAPRVPLETSTARITIAVPSFLHDLLLPRLAAVQGRPIRGLVVPPTSIDAHVERSLLDAAITIGSLPRLPATWSHAHLMNLRSGLFASARVSRAIGEAPTVADVLAHRFVGAVYVSRAGEVSTGNDLCPVPREQRVVGHEVESIRSACVVAAESDQLVYGPAIAAAALVAEGRLVELTVPGWSRFDALYLSTDDQVLGSHVREILGDAIQDVLKSNPLPSGVVSISSTPGALVASEASGGANKPARMEAMSPRSS